jgi:hypothetical protein
MTDCVAGRRGCPAPVGGKVLPGPRGHKGNSSPVEVLARAKNIS